MCQSLKSTSEDVRPDVHYKTVCLNSVTADRGRSFAFRGEQNGCYAKIISDKNAFYSTIRQRRVMNVARRQIVSRVGLGKHFIFEI